MVFLLRYLNNCFDYIQSEKDEKISDNQCIIISVNYCFTYNTIHSPAVLLYYRIDMISGYPSVNIKTFYPFLVQVIKCFSHNMMGLWSLKTNFLFIAFIHICKAFSQFICIQNFFRKNE